MVSVCHRGSLQSERVFRGPDSPARIPVDVAAVKQAVVCHWAFFRSRHGQLVAVSPFDSSASGDDDNVPGQETVQRLYHRWRGARGDDVAQHVPAKRPRTPAISSKGVRAKRWEVFDPDLQQEHRAKNNGLKFTKGKKYPIFEEISLGEGIPPQYLTLDDVGAEKQVGCDYFVAPTAGLSFEGQMTDGPAVNEDDGLWAGHKIIGNTDSIPEVR